MSVLIYEVDYGRTIKVMVVIARLYRYKKSSSHCCIVVMEQSSIAALQSFLFGTSRVVGHVSWLGVTVVPTGS